MAIVDSIVIFLVNLMIGGIGIYIGAKFITGEENFGYALVSALLGAAVWAVISFLLTGLEVLGPLLALISWIAVIRARYRKGWINAILIAVVSWIAVLITLSLLSWVGITGFTAIGVPLG